MPLAACPLFSQVLERAWCLGAACTPMGGVGAFSGLGGGLVGDSGAEVLCVIKELRCEIRRSQERSAKRRPSLYKGSSRVTPTTALQGFFAHMKQPPRRSLQ